jgi:hypothetical protein
MLILHDDTRGEMAPPSWKCFIKQVIIYSSVTAVMAENAEF